jgi:predicted Zn-ribbon and HTH transcriptional regulator
MKFSMRLKELFNVICPVCGSYDIEGDSFDFHDDKRVEQVSRCLKCKKEWIDVYTITNRIIIED